MWMGRDDDAMVAVSTVVDGGGRWGKVERRMRCRNVFGK